jgi:hypothetical protein
MRTLHRPHRPVDAAMAALRDSGTVAAELRKRLERCDTKRFHLHRTLMRVRWALDNATSVVEVRANIDKILSEAGYSRLEIEEVA